MRKPLGAPVRAEIKRVGFCPFEPDLDNTSVGKWNGTACRTY